MSQQNEADQLKQRSEELNAQETRLKAWEAELKANPVTIKVTREIIRVKEQQLAELNYKLDVVEDKIKKLDNLLIKQTNEYKTKLKRITRESQKLDNDFHVKQEQLKTGVNNLKEVNNEIKARQTYLKEQEQAITEAIDNGNETLLNAQTDIKILENQKQGIIQDIADLNSQKIDTQFNLQLSVQEATKEAELVQANLSEQTAKFEEQLTAMKAKLTKTSNDRKTIVEEIEGKQRTLKITEEGLMAKRDALQIERQQLEEDKRRWTSAKSLYTL